MERFLPAETTRYEVAQYDYLTMPCSHKGRHTENVILSWYREQSWKGSTLMYESQHITANNDKDGRFYIDSKGKNLTLRKIVIFNVNKLTKKLTKNIIYKKNAIGSFFVFFCF